MAAAGKTWVEEQVANSCSSTTRTENTKGMRLLGGIEVPKGTRAVVRNKRKNKSNGKGKGEKKKVKVPGVLKDTRNNHVEEKLQALPYTPRVLLMMKPKRNEKMAEPQGSGAKVDGGVVDEPTQVLAHWPKMGKKRALEGADEVLQAPTKRFKL